MMTRLHLQHRYNSKWHVLIVRSLLQQKKITSDLFFCIINFCECKGKAVPVYAIKVHMISEGIARYKMEAGG